MKWRYLAWILPVILCCCNKNPPSLPVTEPFSFYTTYDSIVTCTTNTEKLLLFSIVVTGGIIDTNPVTYSIDNLPPNISVSPTTQTVTLMQGGLFTFTIGNAPAGMDSASLTISSNATGTEHHKLIFQVNTGVDYATKLAGSYPGSYDYCTPADSIYAYTATASAITGTPHELKIINIKNLGPDFVATAMITTTVTIPFQTIGAYKLWGSGTYTHDKPPYESSYQMIIYDTLVNGLDTEKCIIHLQH